MIPEVFIENWRKTVPWQMTEQIQQDLMISRALVDLYNDPHVKDALVFRGGTALNKLFINPPARYSEDIDFVQKNADPIGQTIDAIRALLKPWLGDPKWKITQRRKGRDLFDVWYVADRNLINLNRIFMRKDVS